MPALAFHRVAQRHPADVAPLLDLFARGLHPRDVVALWSKTSGHGLANDVTRPYAELSLLQCAAAASGDDIESLRDRIQIIVSGGCEGAIVPHLIVVSVSRETTREEEVGAVVADAREAVAPELIGTEAHATLTRSMVLAASGRAGIQAADEIRFVMVRTPAPSTSTALLGEARRAAAQGIAAARHDPDRIGPAAFVVARPGDRIQHVVVLGHAKGGNPRLRIGSTMLRDPLDAPAVANCVAKLGVRFDAVQVAAGESHRVLAAFVKGDAPPSTLRGSPHAMSDDPLMPAHRHARAAYGGMAAAVLGTAACFVSAGAEGHGPAHGGSFAAVVAA